MRMEEEATAARAAEEAAVEEAAAAAAAAEAAEADLAAKEALEKETEAIAKAMEEKAREEEGKQNDAEIKETKWVNNGCTKEKCAAFEAKAEAAEAAAMSVEAEAAGRTKEAREALGQVEGAVHTAVEVCARARDDARVRADQEALARMEEDADTELASERARAAAQAEREHHAWLTGTNPTIAKQCRLYGEGLVCTARGVGTSFTIEACDQWGRKQPKGGDVFFVCVRSSGQGTRMAAKVGWPLDGLDS